MGGTVIDVTHLLEVCVRRVGSISGRRVCKLVQGNNGVLLVETVIAVLVFGLVGAAVMSGLATTHRSGFKIEVQSNAESIARNQMEYVFSLPYQEPPYFYPTVIAPQGYGVTSEAREHINNDPNIEEVIVTVTFEGEPKLVVETMRVR